MFEVRRQPQDKRRKALSTMLDIVKNSQHHNGNGSVNGRGVLRRKLSPTLRVNLAADVAMGLTQLTPSLKQTAVALGVSPYSVRQELKARAKKQEVLERAQQVQAEAQYIADVWTMASIQVQQEAIRHIGVHNVWDALASVVG
jgi:hypothetical protein